MRRRRREGGGEDGRKRRQLTQTIRLMGEATLV